MKVVFRTILITVVIMSGAYLAFPFVMKWAAASITSISLKYVDYEGERYHITFCHVDDCDPRNNSQLNAYLRIAKKFENEIPSAFNRGKLIAGTRSIHDDPPFEKYHLRPIGYAKDAGVFKNVVCFADLPGREHQNELSAIPRGSVYEAFYATIQSNPEMIVKFARDRNGRKFMSDSDRVSIIQKLQLKLTWEALI